MNFYLYKMLYNNRVHYLKIHILTTVCFCQRSEIEFAGKFSSRIRDAEVKTGVPEKKIILIH